MYSHLSTLHMPSFFIDSSCCLNLLYLLCPSLSYKIYRSLPVLLSSMGFARCPCLSPCLFGSAGFSCLPGFLIPACRFDSVQTLLSLSTRFSSHASGSSPLTSETIIYLWLSWRMLCIGSAQMQPCDHMSERTGSSGRRQRRFHFVEEVTEVHPVRSTSAWL